MHKLLLLSKLFNQKVMYQYIMINLLSKPGIVFPILLKTNSNALRVCEYISTKDFSERLSRHCSNTGKAGLSCVVKYPYSKCYLRHDRLSVDTRNQCLGVDSTNKEDDNEGN